MAITGSAARGDAVDGSDLDLWCVSPRYRGHQRRHGRFDRIDVTLLCDGPRSSVSAWSLARCEAGGLICLHDPQGLFDRVQERFVKQKARRIELLHRNTSQRILADLDSARKSQRLEPLQEVGIQLASAWIYLHHGWHSPHWRTFRAVLPDEAFDALKSILRLPTATAAKNALLRVQRALARTRSPVLPRRVRTRMRAGDWSEAVLLARRHLEREVLPVNHWPRALECACHALQGSPLASIEEIADRLLALDQALRVLDHFSPKVRQRIETLAGAKAGSLRPATRRSASLFMFAPSPK